MKFLNIILLSLSTSFGLVKQQIVRTFGRDTSVVDKEVIDIVLSNPDNKQKLIKELDKNSSNHVEIEIKDNKFSIVN